MAELKTIKSGPRSPDCWPLLWRSPATRSSFPSAGFSVPRRFDFFAAPEGALELVNIGGDDVYDVKGDGIAGNINRSIAALIDIGGDDVYRGKAGSRPGNSRYDERFTESEGRSTYWTDSSSLALFLDIGGTDTYASHPPSEDKPEDDADKPDTPPAPFGGKNNGTWLDEPDSLNPKVRNFSIGLDRADGEVGFLPIPMLPVPGKR